MLGRGGRHSLPLHIRTGHQQRLLSPRPRTADGARGRHTRVPDEALQRDQPLQHVAGLAPRPTAVHGADSGPDTGDSVLGEPSQAVHALWTSYPRPKHPRLHLPFLHTLHHLRLRPRKQPPPLHRPVQGEPTQRSIRQRRGAHHGADGRTGAKHGSRLPPVLPHHPK